MRREEINVAVMRIEGTNCEEETSMCFRESGVNAEMVHLNQLTGRSTVHGEQRSLEDYHILVFPGGFSAGDYIRAGAIFAARFKSAIGPDLRRFVEEGKPVGGICNGFQILVEMGLLPGLGDTMTDRPEIALATNDSSRFECRPTYLKHFGTDRSAFTGSIGTGDVVYAPSAHMEGKFTLKPGQESSVLEELEENGQIIFRYVDPDGNDDGYPWNPNGSISSVAAISNPSGNVFGMMPHPERSFFAHLHPGWTRHDPPSKGEKGDGVFFFESSIDHVTRRF